MDSCERIVLTTGTYSSTEYSQVFHDYRVFLLPHTHSSIDMRSIILIEPSFSRSVAVKSTITCGVAGGSLRNLYLHRWPSGWKARLTVRAMNIPNWPTRLHSRLTRQLDQHLLAHPYDPITRFQVICKRLISTINKLHMAKKKDSKSLITSRTLFWLIGSQFLDGGKLI